ncbi:Uncharacterised protein [Clostridioides difficile]|nr:Uncharacterised protein [Clostridioides difficile]
MKFIYALNEDDKNELLNKGFNFINEQNINNQKFYLFENNSNIISMFSKEDKMKFIFSNILYF